MRDFYWCISRLLPAHRAATRAELKVAILTAVEDAENERFWDGDQWTPAQIDSMRRSARLEPCS